MKLALRIRRGKAVCSPFMHLQHDVNVSLCSITAKVMEAIWKPFRCVTCFILSWGSWIANECDSITLTYHECCTLSNTGLFPDAHTQWSCLTVPFLRYVYDLQSEPASGNGVKELCMCVALYTGHYMFCGGVEPRVLDGALYSLHDDQLQRDPLSLSVPLTKISLCFWRSAVTVRSGQNLPIPPPPSHLFQLRVSLSLFIPVPLSESSSWDGPTVSFEWSWQTGSFNPLRCQSEW